MAEVVRIQLRRGTSSEWTATNPTLAEGEFGIETNTGKFKIGDGITAWSSISNYFEPVDLSDYITTSDLSTELADYVTSTELSTDLADYLTTTSASSTYQTQAAMSLYATLSGATFTGDVILNADPTNSLGAATKQYVDNVATGLQTKPAVNAATTGNLSGTYDNGTAGVGATLNLGQLASLDIDGVTDWELLDGVLLRLQTDATENGRWVVDQIGNDVDTDWILRRCSLCDDATEIPGAYMFVSDGDTLSGTGWVLTVDDPSTFTVGTDDITANNFTASTTYTAGTGLSLSSGEFSIDSTVATLTGTQTMTNKTVQGAAVNDSIFISPVEKFQTLTNTGGLVQTSPDTANTPSVGLYYSTAGSNFIFQMLNLTVPSDKTYVYTLIVNNPTSGTPAELTSVYRGGAGVNVLWAGGVQPPSTNGIDVYTFTFIGTNTYCIGSMTSYYN